MPSLFVVCLGGAIGAGARYLACGVIAPLMGLRPPWSTLTVNVLGSFLFALLLGRELAGVGPGPTARLFVATGLLGGFTTYSTFNGDVLRLLREGALGAAAFNVVLTVAFSLGVGAIGLWIGRQTALG